MKQLLTAKATLTTRCGCYKHIDIPWPPTHDLIVPLKPKNFPSVFQLDDLSKQIMETRRFTLTDAGGSSPDGFFAYYEEVPL